jgi:hypothetical protein
MTQDALGGNADNKSISELTSTIFGHKEGKFVISNRNAETRSSVIISDDGVIITNQNSTVGVMADRGSVTLQGVIYESSKSKNIRKGEYAENDKTKKIFTYQETILVESIPKDVAAQIAGQAGLNIAQGPVEGVDMALGMDGIMPIWTDVSAGPKPHVHSISMKHVHRIEPGHLYRIPEVIGFVKSCLTQLTSFLNA